MAENTAIEWTDHTFNPWYGCQKVSPGCDNCYAEGWGKRSGLVKWGPGEERKRSRPDQWRKIERLNANAIDFRNVYGRWPLVFCASLGDWLDNAVPMEWRADLLELIERTPNLRWQLLSKRIGNLLPLVAERDHRFFRRNSHVGAMITAVDQREADRDVPKQLSLKAELGIRWVGVSYEPALGPVDFRPWQHAIDQIITGGESGPKARPMHPDWVRSVRDQCAAANVPFLFKQWGEWSPDLPLKGRTRTPLAGIALDGRIEHEPSLGEIGDLGRDAALMWRIGKKRAGRLLDGIEHNGFPEALLS